MELKFSAEMISSFIGGEIVGDKSIEVSKLSSIEGGEEGSLSYLTNPKYEEYIYSSNASIVIVGSEFQPKREVKPTLIKVEDSTAAFLKLLEMYNAAISQRRTGVSKLASVAEGVVIPDDAYVGDFTVIEEGVEVGAGAQIYPQCYVGRGSKIGSQTTLYAGVKIYYGTRIGAECIIHSGCVIGADGFGFAPKADGSFDKIPQLGCVIIEDFVEIGANSCIDRAKIDSTIISRGVKLDNLCQVGHNVFIGENTVSSAQLGIAGSSSMGSGCMVGGQVGIADHVAIGNNCRIGSKSGLDKSVPDGEVRMGYPALPGIQFHRSTAALKDLPQIARTVREVVKKVDKLTPQE
ncbi:MAG: UDP-3-O-(3-hydroxymyristoyl)glucosamine N-acyltransferase [Rikenellaceae bacterium]